MLLEVIETPDMQLAKLLIARKLKDLGADVDPARIKTSMKNADLHSPPVQFQYPLHKTTVRIRSIISARHDLRYKDIVALVDEQAEEY